MRIYYNFSRKCNRIRPYEWRVWFQLNSSDQKLEFHCEVDVIVKFNSKPETDEYFTVLNLLQSLNIDNK